MPIYRRTGDDPREPGPAGPAHLGDDDPTVRITPAWPRRGAEAAPAPPEPEPEADSAGDDERTRLIGPSRRQTEQRQPVRDAMDDPVVGWLVVVAGPGKGSAHRIGYGMNGLGRGPEDRVRLDFGDDQMSRSSHAHVTYDPRSRRFFVHHGGGRNLTYLGQDPVLAPTELLGGEEITIGTTTLRFVPFCGRDFDWQEQS